MTVWRAFHSTRKLPAQLVRYVNDTIQFHSTLAYLANPPSSYQQPAVDLVDELSQLQHDIDHGVFHNEYAFETALRHLIHAARDDHLTFVGGAFSRFTYIAPYGIVSISLDGIELPKVYILDDLFANETGYLPWQPSAIATINGQDVVEYLAQFAALNSIGKLEPHADWNMLMRSAALDLQGKREVNLRLILEQLPELMLSANCARDSADKVKSELPLDRCLGYSHWQGIYKKANESALRITAPIAQADILMTYFYSVTVKQEGSRSLLIIVYACTDERTTGSNVTRSFISLDETIENRDGYLSCHSVKGEPAQ
ncbi:hypothetical protein BDV26DRAFT_287916 [Aspergillus bertholletiae]|uniref:Uncharacterized protein n=1 Tax=Aspergillus bertholletiae TaxID=1226010 RepID=A0A5N7BMX6_9EURO|nr:hypothetical protein BDV26DRAFT_287916 [Aspergillus bertholletiae]